MKPVGHESYSCKWYFYLGNPRIRITDRNSDDGAERDSGIEAGLALLPKLPPGELNSPLRNSFFIFQK